MLTNPSHPLSAIQVPGTHEFVVEDRGSARSGYYSASVEYLGGASMVLFWRDAQGYWIGWRTSDGRCSNNASLLRVLQDLTP
jgi:hypothetical protein